MLSIFKKDEKKQIYNLFRSSQDGLESQTKNLDESYCGFLLSPRCEVFCYWHGPFNGSSMQWYKRTTQKLYCLGICVI